MLLNIYPLSPRSDTWDKFQFLFLIQAKLTRLAVSQQNIEILALSLDIDRKKTFWYWDLQWYEAEKNLTHLKQFSVGHIELLTDNISDKSSCV